VDFTGSKTQQQKMQADFEALARFFSDMGFGGDASTGKGHFQFTMKDFTLKDLPSNPNAVTSLSLYFPKQNEVDRLAASPERLWYKLERRKGKVGGVFFKPQNPWKYAVNVFSEGGSFPDLGVNHTYGSSPVVKSLAASELHGNMDIRYNGYALMLPYEMKDNKPVRSAV